MALVAALTVVACVQQPFAPGDESAGPLPNQSRSEDVAIDRIAYVTDDGDLFTINADGTDQLKLTGTSQMSSSALQAVLAQPSHEDSLYTWPTWAPDGEKIAASHVEVSRGSAVISVEVIEVVNGKQRKVFTNESPSLVAQGAPHYLYWSPDSAYLAVLAGSSEGLTLWVVDVAGSADPVAVATGAPLYFHWSMSSDLLAIHVGDDLIVARKPFDTPAPAVRSGLVGFRVPAVSPDGAKVAYTDSVGSGNALLVGQIGDLSGTQSVVDVGELSAFAWSPDGAQIAVVDSQEARSGAFQRLRVAAANGSSVRTVAEGAIVSFYWSPTGKGLAWLDLDGSGERARWWVEDGTGTPGKELFGFQPSSDTGIMLWFFDQYGYSHSPWSPDGRHLVFAGLQRRGAGSANGHSPSGDRVFVLDVEGGNPPRELAAGKLAFWSWN